MLEAILEGITSGLGDVISEAFTAFVGGLLGDLLEAGSSGGSS